jgi:hypothetical protein
MTSPLWAGRIISALASLFLLFDATIHVLNIAPVVAAFAQLGYPDSLAAGIGVVEFVCIALYIIPPTAILGGILLTGYLGGATAAQVRIGGPFLFSIAIGILVWAGLFFQCDELRRLLPVRRSPIR